MSIRPYHPADLARLHEITAATFGPVSIDGNMQKILGQFGRADQAGWQNRKLAAITDDCRLQPDGVFVSLDDQGHITGYITTRLNRDSAIGWIPNLAVDPAYQGQGTGRALIQHALDFLRDQGMQVAKIETLDQNAIGQSLYSSFGFKEVARQIHYAMRLDKPV
jgi:ribosomal protein S18 acetylase RimI-like enzyme